MFLEVHINYFLSFMYSFQIGEAAYIFKRSQIIFLKK